MNLTHDRRALVEVLAFHQRTSIEACACGWSELGASHAEHVADVYELELRTSQQNVPVSVQQARERLKADAITYGERLDTNPYTILLDEVQWRAGHVSWLRSQIQAKLPDELFAPNRHGELVDIPLVQRYDKERDRLDRIVHVAITAGIAERYVRLAELHGEVMQSVLQAALSDPVVGLTPEQRVQLIESMKRALAARRTLVPIETTGEPG